MMAPPTGDRNKIIKPKLLLTEGADAKFFCIWSLDAYKVDDVQVMDFGGIAELSLYLKTLSGLFGYEEVTTIVIARDAEKSTTAAINNIKKALKGASLPVPAKPFYFSGNTPRVAFMLFPGFDDTKKLVPGTLEDLCAQIIKDNDPERLGCVREYLACLKEQGKKIKREHKSFLHTYFAGEDRFVGLKIGEASKAGAWDWDHEKLKPFKEIIEAM